MTEKIEPCVCGKDPQMIEDCFPNADPRWSVGCRCGRHGPYSGCWSRGYENAVEGWNRDMKGLRLLKAIIGDLMDPDLQAVSPEVWREILARVEDES